MLYFLKFLIIFPLFMGLSNVQAHEKTRGKKSPAVGTIKPYKKAQIVRARYGNKKQQELFAKVMKFRGTFNKRFVGQDATAAALQMRLLQYLHSIGSRTREPMAFHMIGLPGVGKTSIVEVLHELGLPLYRVNAEKFPGGESATGSTYFLMEQLEKALSDRGKDDPLILFVDEPDKVPEIKDGEEINQPLISTLNEILSEGKVANIRHAGSTLNFTNVFILTAMNFAPEQLEKFSEEIFGEEKSFWDFSEADMETFDRWIHPEDEKKGSPVAGYSSVAKILSLLFRSNTVGRLLPDVRVTNTLHGKDIPQLVKLSMEFAIGRLSQNQRQALHVTYSQAYLDFLRNVTTFAPSGARMSVKRIDLLSEQLMTVGARATIGKKDSLALPRSIHLDFNPGTQEALLTVNVLVRQGKNTKVSSSKVLNIKYNSSIGAFDIPMEYFHLPSTDLLTKAEDGYEKEETKKRLSSGQIRKERQVLNNDHKLEKYLNEAIAGQPEIAKALDEDLNLYMKLSSATLNAAPPIYRVIPGFTGVGKTASIMAMAEKLGLPVVKMNMQEYSGDSQESASQFAEDLFQRIDQAQKESDHGKYLLLLEELDKANEVNPKDGSTITRPVIACLKDLLNDGTRTVTVKINDRSYQRVLDIHSAFTAISMNFLIDRHDIKADPRLTTIEDMQRIYEEISSSPAAMRDLFRTLFLPDTVNRILSKNILMARPLNKKSYVTILNQQIHSVLSGLGIETSTQVSFSKSYFEKYLYAESVIPSEGGRQAALTSYAILRHDILKAIQAISKKSLLYSRPIKIILDYKPKTEKNAEPLVIATAKLSESADIQKNKGSDLKEILYSMKPSLRFPPLVEYGKLPVTRSLVAAHEFGHAFAAVFFGFRIEFANSTSPMPGIGGYVKGRDSAVKTGRYLLANIFFSLGSRAMERLIFSEPSGKKFCDGCHGRAF